ncbi:MAG: T9SS type A sorting domain-containing protein [Saprospiraceae bacterium]|nr:T9SS type A sorting domain-containing protein [Saprospiraceae bacterium]
MYTALPIVLENLEAKKPYEIIIWDFEKEACSLVVNIPAIECSSATDDVTNNTIRLINNNETVEVRLDNLWIPGNIKLIDMSGKIISSTTSLSINQLDISLLPPGMYLLNFTNTHYNYTKKIMKF